MHEYEILFHRWRKYRRKKMVFRSLPILVVVLAMSYGAYHLYERIKNTQNQTRIEQKENILLPAKDFEKNLIVQSQNYSPPPAPPPRKQIYHQPRKKPKPKEKKPLFLKEYTFNPEQIKRRFQNNPKSSLALLLARYYYKKKLYKQAAKWALKANELDKTNEESWFLFAKSLAKLGQKQKAISVLRIYLKKSDSQKAKALLHQIVNGAAL